MTIRQSIQKLSLSMIALAIVVWVFPTTAYSVITYFGSTFDGCIGAALLVLGFGTMIHQVLPSTAGTEESKTLRTAFAMQVVGVALGLIGVWMVQPVYPSPGGLDPALPWSLASSLGLALTAALAFYLLWVMSPVPTTPENPAQ